MRAFKQSWLLGPAAAASLGLVAGPATAHHSFAAYDMSRTLAAEGTIKEFRWGAPHASMVLFYRERGKQKQMSLITGSPLMFTRQGFNPRDFRRGGRVKVTYHPNSGGQPGGAMASVTLPDGRIFSDTEAARAGGS